MIDSREMFIWSLDPANRFAQAHREPRDEKVLGIEFATDAETAANVGLDRIRILPSGSLNIAVSMRGISYAESSSAHGLRADCASHRTRQASRGFPAEGPYTGEW